MKKYNLVAISDTHNNHEKMTIPECDFLIHAGDATGRGSEKELNSFFSWFSRQPAKHKIFVAGNHDWGLALEQRSLHEEEMKRLGIYYLNETSITIENIDFFGSPATPQFGGWAFMKTPNQLNTYWEMIPSSTDVLITHGPPFKILDSVIEKNVRSRSYDSYYKDDNVGCPSLAKTVEMNKNIRLHLFGHIHESGGETYSNGQTLFANASSLDGHYCLKTNNFLVFELEVQMNPKKLVVSFIE